MNKCIHLDLATWIVPGRILTGKPPPGSVYEALTLDLQEQGWHTARWHSGAAGGTWWDLQKGCWWWCGLPCSPLLAPPSAAVVAVVLQVTMASSSCCSTSLSAACTFLSVSHSIQLKILPNPLNPLTNSLCKGLWSPRTRDPYTHTLAVVINQSIGPVGS